MGVLYCEPPSKNVLSELSTPKQYFRENTGRFRRNRPLSDLLHKHLTIPTLIKKGFFRHKDEKDLQRLKPKSHVGRSCMELLFILNCPRLTL